LLKLEIYLQDDHALSHGSAANVFIHGLNVMHLICGALNSCCTESRTQSL